MTLLVLVALPEPHFELQELHELQEDTWQSITGGNENVMEVTEHGNFIQIQILMFVSLSKLHIICIHPHQFCFMVYVCEVL